MRVCVEFRARCMVKVPQNVIDGESFDLDQERLEQDLGFEDEDLDVEQKMEMEIKEEQDRIADYLQEQFFIYDIKDFIGSLKSEDEPIEVFHTEVEVW